MKRHGPKHKICRRIGSCIWGSPKCPSNKRGYPAGAHGRDRRSKLSTYGELLIEKQKLRAHYALTEKQLRIAYKKAKSGTGSTPEKFMQMLELRLASMVYRTGMAPTIFAAKQAVNHGHIHVDGKRVDRNGYQVKAGQTISIDPQKSPSIATISQKSDVIPPPYIDLDKQNCKASLIRPPTPEEIPSGAEIIKVVEFYAR